MCTTTRSRRPRAAVLPAWAALAAVASLAGCATTADVPAVAAGPPPGAVADYRAAIEAAGAGDDSRARALLEQAVAACGQCAPMWNELGMVQRHQGEFAAAEASYRRAIEAEPALAEPHYNLAILYDLYLQRPELALAAYSRFRELSGDVQAVAQVDKWIADLERRAGAIERAAQLEATP